MGHDTARVGRDSQGRCVECRRLNARLWWRKLNAHRSKVECSNLQSVRIEQGFSIKTLSRVSGVTRYTIRRIENGYPAQRQTVIMLSAAMDVTPLCLVSKEYIDDTNSLHSENESWA